MDDYDVKHGCAGIHIHSDRSIDAKSYDDSRLTHCCNRIMADNIEIPEAKPLNDPPTDGITKLCYLQHTSKLASTSWDGSVRVHDTIENKLLLNHSMDSGPLFSFSYQNSMLFTGGMDGSIRKFDMNSSKQQATLVGKQKANADGSDKASCSCLAVIAPGLVASAGWHQQFHLWDLRQQSPVATVDLPGKAFAMDYTSKTGDGGMPADSSWVAIATSGRRTCFIDVRTMQEDTTATPSADLILDRESTLKYQSRCVRFLPDAGGIAIGSIEGRAAIENLEELGRKEIKNFAFKCHRDGDLVYPVNSIDFHPGFGTFVTGGGDGTVGTNIVILSIWFDNQSSDKLHVSLCNSDLGWYEQKEAHNSTQIPYVNLCPGIQW